MIVAPKLPPHDFGDAYLMTPVPSLRPGEFDPKMMPTDGQGTRGEVAMALWLGVLDKAFFSKIHRAAHPDGCKYD